MINNLQIVCLSVLLANIIYFALPFEPNLYSLCIIFLIHFFFIKKINKNIALFIIVFFFTITISTVKTNLLSNNTIIKKKIFIENLYSKVIDISYYKNYVKFIIEPKNKKFLPKYIKLTVRQNYDEINIGDMISCNVIIMQPSNSIYPDSYNFKIYAFFNKIGAFGYSASKPLVYKNNKKIYTINKIRTAIDKKLFDLMPEESASIASAMITGKKTKIDKNIKNIINKSGIAHLLAISGLHMSIIGVFTFKLFRLIMSCFFAINNRFNIKKISASIAIFVSFLYLLISGNQVTAQRAFIVMTLFYFTILFEKNHNTKNSTAFAVIVILIINPVSIINPSFQLSFAAISGILMSNKITYKIKNKFIKFLITPMIISTITTLTTAPYIAYHFNCISISGIITNIIAIPIASYIIMPFGIIMLFFIWNDLISKLSVFFVKNGIFILIKIAHITKNIPSIQVKHMPSNALFFISLAIILFFLFEKQYLIFSIFIIIFGISIWFFHKQPNILLYNNAVVIADENNNFNIINGKINQFTIQTWIQKYPHYLIKKNKNKECSIFNINGKKISISKKENRDCIGEINVNILKKTIEYNGFTSKYFNNPIFIYIKKDLILINKIQKKIRPWL